MSLEDFHTKAVRLVTKAGYEGDAKDQVLRDTIISGIASEKIRAKIVKEGHKVTLNLVMEIARLEVSTQQHLDRMQETAKVNYVQYGKLTKNKKGKKSGQSGASGGSYRGNKGHGTSSKLNGKGKKLPFPQDTCYRCGKGRHQKVQDCKALDVVCRGCGKEGHFKKVCLKKCSTHSLEVPQASTSTAGAGASEPLYFDDEGQPVFAHMVSVPHANKHLIKMENYGNTAVKVLRMFHMFLRWKDKVYKQLFYVTDCDRSPNLLSRDACYTLGVLKPCYTVENSRFHRLYFVTGDTHPCIKQR